MGIGLIERVGQTAGMAIRSGNACTYAGGQEAAVLRANVDSSCAQEGDTSTRPDVEIVNVNLTQTKLHSYTDSSGSEGLVFSPRSPPSV